MLSRNPDGTFQVRIRGQEQTRTERDVAYMTGMNKPALDAHLDGVTAGRKGGATEKSMTGFGTSKANPQKGASSSFYANIPPPEGIPAKSEWVLDEVVAYWDDKLAKAKVRAPADYEEIAPNIGKLGPINRVLVHRAIQSFLDMIPGDIARLAGPFDIYAEEVIHDDSGDKTDAVGMWKPNNVGKTGNPAREYEQHIRLSYDLAKNEYNLRSTIWHEMTHWLWENADKHPRLQKWRADLEQHFTERTVGEKKQWNSKGGYYYWEDGWIESYAGRDYPDMTPGIELPTVYMQRLCQGGAGVARWADHRGAISTFELVMAILGDKK